MSEQPAQTTRPWLAWLWFERSTVGLPLILLVIDVIGTTGANGGWQHNTKAFDLRPLDWIAWVLVLAGPVALQRRKQFPRIALVVCIATTLIYLLMGYAYGPIFLNAMIAILVTSSMGYRREAWAGALVFAVGMFFVPNHKAPGQNRTGMADVLSTFGWLLALVLVAELFRVLRQRALQAHRVREEELRRQSSEERLAIARELHDVLAHSISLIAVQANVALEVMDRRPEQARIALSAIKDASRTALGEVRSVLTVLRGEQAVPRDPAPDLGRLPHLVELAEATGLKVAVSVIGDLGRVPLAVSQAGYRIVQESLTNVVRHSGAAGASILVEAGGELRLRVTDDGRGAPLDHSSGSGKGLAGMRERASAFGGELTAAPKPAGGFRVDARIPYPEETR